MSDTLKTKPTRLIEFNGRHLIVIKAGGVEYLPARVFTEYVSMAWNSAKRTLFRGYNAELYGTIELIPPSFGGLADTSVQKPVVFIRLDAVEAFFMKSSTNHMLAKNGEAASKSLHALQKEWRAVLHKYEQGEIVVKPMDNGRMLKDLLLIKGQPDDTTTQIMRDSFEETYGKKLPPQSEMHRQNPSEH